MRMILKKIINSFYKHITAIVVTTITIVFQPAFPQGFVVMNFKQNISDGSAFNAPLDGEGHPCGLIKVRTENPDLQFKGNIVGDIENKMNEYWVYMPQSSQSLRINHPNYMPLSIVFADYGIELSPKATCILTLAETKYKKEKTGVTIIAKPEDAELYIDDVFIDNLNSNGFYQMYLPKGGHVFKLSKKGFSPNVQVVQTGRASQNINVELESVMAELEVKCKTTTAEIYVDGKLMGNGIWKGELIAGNHIVETKQMNFQSISQSITLEEKEHRLLVLQEMKRSNGRLCVDTNPSRIPIVIDGKEVGKSPCKIEIETGTHYIICNPMGRYGCNPLRVNVEVTSDKDTKSNLVLEQNNERDEYNQAYSGNIEAMTQLATNCYWQGEDCFDEAVFWAERIPNVEQLYAEIKFDGSDKSHSLALLCNPDKFADYLRREERKEPNDEWKKDLNGFGSKLAQEYNYLGDSYKMRKEYDKAIDCYRKFDHDSKYESIGDCYLKKGNAQEAINYYKMCLKGNISDYTKEKVEKKLKDLGI